MIIIMQTHTNELYNYMQSIHTCTHTHIHTLAHIHTLEHMHIHTHAHTFLC